MKTRLAAVVGDHRAAELYHEFIATVIARVGKNADQKTLWFAPSECGAVFSELAGDDWQVHPQSEGDLGRRMQQMFESELSVQGCQCVLLGTDSPNLPTDYVERAFAALLSARLVLGPADDGGYYLIGACGEVPPVFDEMPFSTPRLWDATISRLAEMRWREGIDYVVLPPWYDIDTADDLARLRSDLEQPPDVDDPILRHLYEKLPEL